MSFFWYMVSLVSLALLLFDWSEVRYTWCLICLKVIEFIITAYSIYKTIYGSDEE